MNIQLKYERLICNAHNCNRRELPGADSDLYNNLNLNDNSFEMGVRFGKIVTSIRYATNQMIESGKYSDLEIENIEELADEGLIEPIKKEVDKVIEKLFEYSKKLRS